MPRGDLAELGNLDEEAPFGERAARVEVAPPKVGAAQ
jgi:hypothetical protein